MSSRNYTKSTELFPMAARTTHVAAPPSQINLGFTGVRIDIQINAFTGTSITFTVQYNDPAGGGWLTLLASTALAATGHTVLHIDPRIPAAANVSAQVIVPREIRVLTSGTITSVTYAVAATWSE